MSRNSSIRLGGGGGGGGAAFGLGLGGSAFFASGEGSAFFASGVGAGVGVAADGGPGLDGLRPAAGRARSELVPSPTSGAPAEAEPALSLPAAATVELEFDHQSRADQAVLVPGVVRTGERSVAWIPANGHDFIITFRAVMKCADVRMSP